MNSYDGTHTHITTTITTITTIKGIPGDPAGGKTRVVTQNNAGPTFWVGKQANGGKFKPYWDNVGAVGHYDYGSLTMARTLGSDPNQVAVNGRRVLIGWIGGGSPASQSLARDLSLSKRYELLQAFVPELKTLRVPGSREELESASSNDDALMVIPHAAGSLRVEILATFTWTDVRRFSSSSSSSSSSFFPYFFGPYFFGCLGRCAVLQKTPTILHFPFHHDLCQQSVLMNRYPFLSSY